MLPKGKQEGKCIKLNNTTLSPPPDMQHNITNITYKKEQEYVFVIASARMSLYVNAAYLS